MIKCFVMDFHGYHLTSQGSHTDIFCLCAFGCICMYIYIPVHMHVYLCVFVCVVHKNIEISQCSSSL